MTAFPFDATHCTPAIAIVAAHGMTDLHSLASLPHYAGWLLAPLPPRAVTGIFCACSFAHFAQDRGGPWATGAAHAGALVAGLLRGTDAALRFMLAYLLLWHTPHHYARQLRRGRRRGVLVAVVATLVCLATCRKLPNRLILNDWLQRIAIAHICFDSTLHRAHDGNICDMPSNSA
jgi:hypothetical protein